MSENVIILSWLYVLTLGIYIIWVRHDLPRPWWLTAAAPLAFWLFLGGLLVPLIGALFVSGLVRGIPLLVGGALFWLHFLPNRQPTGQRGLPDHRRWKVMTANLLDTNRCCQGIVSRIREEDADVVALQELNPVHVAALERELGAVYPYRWFLPGPEVPTPGRSEGMGLLSRLPFHRVAVVAADPQANPAQVVSLTLDQRSIGLIHMHPRIPLPRFCRLLGLPLPCGLDDGERMRDVLAILDAAQNVECDAILLGDMNATDQCRPYHLLGQAWCNVFAAVGRGLGMSYPVDAEFFGIHLPWPTFRIDHILIRGRLCPASAHLSDMPGSDHRYLVAEIDLPCI